MAIALAPRGNARRAWVKGIKRLVGKLLVAFDKPIRRNATMNSNAGRWPGGRKRGPQSLLEAQELLRKWEVVTKSVSF